MMKVAFVTGGAGYIGTHLVRTLLGREYQVVAYDLRFGDGFLREFDSRIECIDGDLTACGLRQVVSRVRPTHVFHLAGLKNRSNDADEFRRVMRVNYEGALNLFQALQGVESLMHVVIMGTTEEYGRAKPPFSEETRELPSSAYGLSKLLATRLALLYHSQFGLPVSIVRPSIAFGPGQGNDMFLPALIRALTTGDEFCMTAGEQLRDYIFIDDLVEALIAIGECDAATGEIINIAWGASERLSDVARYTARLLDADSQVKIGVMPYRKTEIMNYSVDIEKARKMLDWKPRTSVFEGIERMVRR